jgi:putative transposase
VRLAPAPPYSPHLKGKVERLQGTVVTTLLAELPQFAGGPRDASGGLWGGALRVLTFAELVACFDAWVLAYNLERPHEGLGGQTPLERWREDATPLRTVEDEELRWTLLEERSRLVRKSGIRFHGIDFVAPEFNGLVGESVAVRYRPHDDTSIEVFRDGAHLCTALPQGALGPEERAAVLERRRQDAARQARLARRATRRARERFAPATSPGPPEEVTVITASAASQERAAHDLDRLRRAARTDLLGLPSRPRP